MSEVESNSIDLIITSPPYPMIEMWDSLYSSLNSDIDQALKCNDGKRAFNLMHNELNKVWDEVTRVLKPGGIACVNIGDATRKIGNNFQLFPNHVKISTLFQKKDYIELPCILWRKPTNSPNKFMGSGMLPPNAYVTLEHEYILIFRKGDVKRDIPPKLENRYLSAFFWEERNRWFSDVWDDIKGTSQYLNKKNYNQNKLRERSASYPLELPYRLINMFSMYEDTVLDPFWGTGTTTIASMILGRNSIGYEINSEFKNIFKKDIQNLERLNLEININRIKRHINFIKKYRKKVKNIKYQSIHYKFPVITKQEINLMLYSIKKYTEEGDKIYLSHQKYDLNDKEIIY
ncbi:MAG: DNA-methyltransferase [Candidatus Odinarchaeota archaeon]